jgi:glycosyltransferase involved in cell wall biosynthesis
MSKRISVIIPNRNGEKTIGKCLEAVYASDYNDFEVIVVDDCSEDRSVNIIKKFPCKIIDLTQHSGASKARNAGAQNSNSRILFFIDADCLLKNDTLTIVNKTFDQKGTDHLIGGTYTKLSYDDRFFSIFQSVFIHYFETKHADNPDYIAAHAMVIDSEVFKGSGGFKEDFLPIIEDVEFSHRLKQSGLKLFIDPEIQVRHIFDFSLLNSLKNAFRKSKFWTMYSLNNRDVFADSGTASAELKVNVFVYLLMIFLLILWLASKRSFLLTPVPIVLFANILFSRKLLYAFHRSKGLLFALFSSLYYFLVYPLPVGLGSFAGIVRYFTKHKPPRHKDTEKK